MIENRQIRFRTGEVELPGGLPEAVEKAVDGRALRWYVGRVTGEEIVVEATIDRQRVDGFTRGIEGQYFPGKSVAVSIVPTGVGCSVGGYAGDAAPASTSSTAWSPRVRSRAVAGATTPAASWGPWIVPR